MTDFKKKAETETGRAGFTLVELVVVIAILGILAGVAYPAYTGYINRAKDAKAESKLSSVLVTVQSALTMIEYTDPVEGISIETGGIIKLYSDTTCDSEITLGKADEFKKDLESLGGTIFTGGVFDVSELEGTSYSTLPIYWSSGVEKWSTTKPTTPAI